MVQPRCVRIRLVRDAPATQRAGQLGAQLAHLGLQQLVALVGEFQPALWGRVEGSLSRGCSGADVGPAGGELA